MKPIILSLLFLLIQTAVGSEILDLKIKTSRGDEIEGKLHLPKNIEGKKLPALIIGPGQGYHMDLPLVKLLAEKSSSKNIVTFRFNWHYFSQNGQPSDGLLKEKQDMQAAFEYVKGLEYIDSSKIMLAGKSLGTMVAYSVFKKNKDIFSIYLLTPICTWHWDENDNQVEPFTVAKNRYPLLLKESRPIHMTLGNRDHLCQIDMLYSYLKDSQQNITTSIFGGDHSMNIGKWDDPNYEDRNARNIEAAVSATIQWLNIHLNQ